MKKFTFEQEYLFLEIEYDSGPPPKKTSQDTEQEDRGVVVIDCLNGNQEVFS